MNLEIRVGAAGNGTPVFMATGSHPALGRPFGAVYDSGRRLWMYPAFYPASKKVLADLDVMSKDFHVTFSDVARRHVGDLEHVEESVANRALPVGFEYVTRPYDHQILGLCHAWWMLRAAIFYAPGLGKSKIAVDLIRLMHHVGQRGTALILGPLVTVTNWGREIDRHSGGQLRWVVLHGSPEERAGIMDRIVEDPPDVVLLTYDGARAMSAEIVRRVSYTSVVCDECFPPGTLVQTNHGATPIETIVVNDKVLSKSIDGQLNWRRVKRVLRRPLRASLVKITHDNGYVVCTHNHNIWTDEFGYVQAGKLTPGMTLNASSLLSLEKMRLVPSNFPFQIQREKGCRRSSILQYEMFCALALRAARYKSQDAVDWFHGCETPSSRRTIFNSRTSPGFILADEERQPGLETRRLGAHRQEVKRKNLSLPWGQWSAYETTNFVSYGARLANRSSDFNSPSSDIVQMSSAYVQGGHWQHTFEGRNRSRWSFSQDSKVAIPGSEENFRVERVRVVSVSCVESGSIVGFGNCNDPHKYVYDLEVEADHNYFANGILVSNSHLVKSWGSGRTIATYDIAQKASRRILMTGSPTQGDPRDTYGQYKILGDCFMPEDYARFKRQFLVTPGPRSHAVTGFKNLDVLNGRVTFLSLRKTKEECLDLPDQVVVDVPYALSRTQKVLHNQLVEQMEVDPDVLAILMFGRQATLPPASRMPHRAAMLIKLLQIASGFLITNPIDDAFCDQAEPGGCRHLEACVEARIRPHTLRCLVDSSRLPDVLTTFDDNPKLDATEELLETILVNPTNKAIIWCTFENELNIVSAMLDRRGWGHVRVDGSNSREAQDLIDRFTAEDGLRVYLAQVSTGVGVTINAASYMIYFALPFSLIVYEQSKDRNYRIGQTRKVTVYRMQGEGTPEPAIARLLDVKIDVDDALTRRTDCMRCEHNPTCIPAGVHPFDAGCSVYKRTIDRPVTRARPFEGTDAPDMEEP